jgi:uncharacterized protein (TIGR03435 family)
MRLMVQSMLEDRFQLKVHREMRDLPVYNLVVAKGGLKMKSSADQTAPDPRKGFIDFTSLAAEAAAPLPRGAMRVAKGPGISVLTANSIPISALVNNLLGQSDRIVVDKTGVKELVDIDLPAMRAVRSFRPALLLLRRHPIHPDHHSSQLSRNSA